MERIPVTKEEVAALAKTARLDLAEDRTQLMAETMEGIFQLLDSLDEVELGETAPAFAYRAKWEGR
jgi:aspartyl/glutamyl-tRNA(Asn/Gln) amidotransferase C subunit